MLLVLMGKGTPATNGIDYQFYQTIFWRELVVTEAHAVTPISLFKEVPYSTTHLSQQRILFNHDTP